MPIDTINSLVAQSKERFANLPAVGFAFKQPLTYTEFYKNICLIAAMLKIDGIKKGTKVAILAENSPAWGAAYLGIIKLGAVAVPVLPDFTEADVRHILRDTKARIIFTTQRQLAKLYDVPSKNIRKIITLDDSKDTNELLTTETFTNCLDRMTAMPPEKKKPPWPKVSRADIASIIYTSGTSGHSKGVMLTHGNFATNVQSAGTLADIGSDWTFLSFLPMSHAYEFTVNFLLPLTKGARIIYADQPPTPIILGEICQSEKPDAICIVPLVMEKIYKKRILPVIGKNKLLKIVFKIPILRKKIYHKLGTKLLDFFGGNLKLMAIGGAPLNNEVENFLAKANFPYLIGYGLTEASPLLSGGPSGDLTIAVGSAGKPMPGVELRIRRPDPKSGIGEVMARGKNIMKGYYNNPTATKETIDHEGWLTTGDLGILDSQNNLFIKGRSKSVIILSHGENIYPESIEEEINSHLHVVESLVFQNHDQIEARIYLDYELINKETTGKSQQHQKEHIDILLKDIQTTVNQQLPTYSRITKIIERTEPFIKTATQKIKRYLYAND